MANDPKFDEVAFQTLWADGLDPLTSAPASYEAGQDHASSDHGRNVGWTLGLITGMVLVAAYYLLW